MATKGKKSIRITPLGDRVLIKPVERKEKEKKSAAGILLLSQGDDDKVDRGTVIAVGPGRIDSNGNLIAMKVKAGDTVLFQWGDRLSLYGEEYFIVNETGILAVMK